MLAVVGRCEPRSYSGPDSGISSAIAPSCSLRVTDAPAPSSMVLDQVVATGREAVTTEPGGDRRQVVVGAEAADPLGTVGGRRLRHPARCRGGDRARGRLDTQVGDLQHRDRHVVVRDELALVDGESIGRVHTRPVARVLPSFGGGFGEGRIRDRHGVQIAGRVRPGPAVIVADSGSLRGRRRRRHPRWRRCPARRTRGRLDCACTCTALCPS